MSAQVDREAALLELQEVFVELGGLRGFNALVGVVKGAESMQTLVEEVEVLSHAVEEVAVEEWLSTCQNEEETLVQLSLLEELLVPARALTRCLRSVGGVVEALDWALLMLAEERETSEATSEFSGVVSG